MKQVTGLSKETELRLGFVTQEGLKWYIKEAGELHIKHTTASQLIHNLRDYYLNIHTNRVEYINEEMARDITRGVTLWEVEDNIRRYMKDMQEVQGKITMINRYLHGLHEDIVKDYIISTYKQFT